MSNSTRLKRGFGVHLCAASVLISSLVCGEVVVPQVAVAQAASSVDQASTDGVVFRDAYVTVNGKKAQPGGVTSEQNADAAALHFDYRLLRNEVKPGDIFLYEVRNPENLQTPLYVYPHANAEVYVDSKMGIGRGDTSKSIFKLEVVDKRFIQVTILDAFTKDQQVGGYEGTVTIPAYVSANTPYSVMDNGGWDVPTRTKPIGQYYDEAFAKGALAHVELVPIKRNGGEPTGMKSRQLYSQQYTDTRKYAAPEALRGKFKDVNPRTWQGVEQFYLNRDMVMTGSNKDGTDTLYSGCHTEFPNKPLFQLAPYKLNSFKSHTTFVLQHGQNVTPNGQYRFEYWGPKLKPKEFTTKIDGMNYSGLLNGDFLWGDGRGELLDTEVDKEFSFGTVGPGKTLNKMSRTDVFFTSSPGTSKTTRMYGFLDVCSTFGSQAQRNARYGNVFWANSDKVDPEEEWAAPGTGVHSQPDTNTGRSSTGSVPIKYVPATFSVAPLPVLYEDKYLSEVRRRGDAPVWDIYRSDNTQQAVGTVDLTHVMAELGKLKDAALNSTTITTLIKDVDNYIKQLDDMTVPESLPDNDRDTYIEQFNALLREVQGLEKRVADIAASVVVAVDYDAKKNVYTLTRADGSKVPGAISVSGDVTAIEVVNNELVVRHSNGSTTKAQLPQLRVDVIGDQTDPQRVIRITQDGKVVAELRAYDGYVTDIKKQNNGDYKLTRLDGEWFVIGTGDIRAKLDEFKNTHATNDDLVAIGSELTTLGQRVDALASQSDGRFDELRSSIQKLQTQLRGLGQRVSTLESTALAGIETDGYGNYTLVLKDGSTVQGRLQQSGSVREIRTREVDGRSVLEFVDHSDRVTRVGVQQVKVATNADQTREVRISVPGVGDVVLDTTDHAIRDISKSVNGDYVITHSDGRKWTVQFRELLEQLRRIDVEIKQLEDRGDKRSDIEQRRLVTLQRAKKESEGYIVRTQVQLHTLGAVMGVHDVQLDQDVARLQRYDEKLALQQRVLVEQRLRQAGVVETIQTIVSELDVAVERLQGLSDRVDVADTRVQTHDTQLAALELDSMVDVARLQCSGNAMAPMLPLLLSVPVATLAYNVTHDARLSVTTLGVMSMLSVFLGASTYSSCRG